MIVDRKSSNSSIDKPQNFNTKEQEVDKLENENLAASGFVQDIPKNADVIIVKGVSFDEVVNVILDRGYVIEKMDKDFQTLKTEYKKLCKDCIPEIAFHVRIKDSTATITGKWRSNGGLWFGMSTSNKDSESAEVFDIKNEKMKVPRTAFQIMNSLALSLNGNITYNVSK